jgi:hypothetical protein
MIRLRHPLVLAAVLAALVGGCGDDDDETTGTAADTATDTAADTAADNGDTETFDDPEFDVTFEYPADFEVLDEITFNRSAGNTAGATAGVGLDESNLLALQRFDLNIAVTKDNLEEVRPEADELFSGLAGEKVEGKEVEVGSLPALEYEITLTEPANAETRATAIFDRQTEYLLNCQSTPEQREAIEAACDTALDTFEVK